MSSMSKARTTMRWMAVAAAAVGLAALTTGAQAQGRSQGYPYSIMTPEPWLAPKYRTPRGLERPARTQSEGYPKRSRSNRGIALAKPPSIVPGVRRPIPNLAPVNRGYVPGGGTETFGDRVSRCAHQQALFRVPGSASSVYMHNCAM